MSKHKPPSENRLTELPPAARPLVWGLALFWILGVGVGWAFGIALAAGLVSNPRTGQAGPDMVLGGYFVVLLTTLMLSYPVAAVLVQFISKRMAARLIALWWHGTVLVIVVHSTTNPAFATGYQTLFWAMIIVYELVGLIPLGLCFSGGHARKLLVGLPAMAIIGAGLGFFVFAQFFYDQSTFLHKAPYFLIGGAIVLVILEVVIVLLPFGNYHDVVGYRGSGRVAGVRYENFRADKYSVAIVPDPSKVSSRSLLVNGKPYGTVQRGDKILVDAEGEITVNGKRRQLKSQPAQAT